jgi:aerobic-type carbon monoxide dehydrogenase small subunit (CoxS/CutS family)
MICGVVVISVILDGEKIYSVFCYKFRLRGTDITTVKKFHMIFKTTPNMHVFGERSSIITDAFPLHFDND